MARCEAVLMPPWKESMVKRKAVSLYLGKRWEEVDLIEVWRAG